MQYMEIHGWYAEFRLQGCTSNVLEKPTLGPPCQLRPSCCANSGRPEKDLRRMRLSTQTCTTGEGGILPRSLTKAKVVFQPSIFMEKNSEFQGKFQPKRPKLLHRLRKFFEKKQRRN